jgi:hypothetical protein
MPVILSLAAYANDILGAGPEGLFLLRDSELHSIPQPMTALYACAVVGDRLIVAGAPHGSASRRIVDGDLLKSTDAEWQGGWMDHTSAPLLALAPMPSSNGDSPTLLVATAGDGILRTNNRGTNWSLCNFGLQEYVVLSLAWSPVPDGSAWLDRQVAFAGTESGVYRSPAAGLAWKRVEIAPQDAVQCISPSANFQRDGVVLLGTENSGVWRSLDGGRTFAAVAETPGRVDALIATDAGFYAGTPEGVFRSEDGEVWTRMNARPALALLAHDGRLIIGNEEGITAHE